MLYKSVKIPYIYSTRLGIDNSQVHGTAFEMKRRYREIMLGYRKEIFQKDEEKP